MHAGPLKLTRVQALAREKAQLEDEIRRADAEIADLEEELQRWQALPQAIHALYVLKEDGHG